MSRLQGFLLVSACIIMAVGAVTTVAETVYAACQGCEEKCCYESKCHTDDGTTGWLYDVTKCFSNSDGGLKLQGINAKSKECDYTEEMATRWDATVDTSCFASGIHFATGCNCTKTGEETAIQRRLCIGTSCDDE